MYKKIFIIIIVILAIAGITKALYPKATALLTMKASNEAIKQSNNSATATSVVSVGMEYGELIRKSLTTAKPLAVLPSTHIGITSHHLPTAAEFISEFYTTLKTTPGPKDTIVVIGPDHFERCEQHASTTKRPYLTPFGTLQSNSKIIDDLKKHGVNEQDNCFDGEHSIGVQAMYIKYLFPESKIVPITLSSATPNEQVEEIAKTLSIYKDQITTVVSVDFSHYQSATKANQLDAFSAEQIKRMDGSLLKLEHMDSPPSIKLAVAFAQSIGEKPQLLKHINSYDITGQPENTTGYWDIIFTEDKKF